MAYEDVRERIRVMFPGDEHKGLRHRLYTAPGFLADNPTDAQIREAAGVNLAPQEVVEATLVGEILTPEEETQRKQDEAKALVSRTMVVVVNTAEDYQEAAKGYATIKSLISDNEASRKRIKQPFLDRCRLIDEGFKKTEELLKSELSRFETPMLAYKEQDRIGLAKAERDRAEALRAEQDRLRAIADEAKAKLEAATSEVEDDPFLAALGGDIVTEAREEAKAALVDLAMAPQRMVTPIDAPVPVVADGVKTTTSWAYEITNPALVDRSLCSPDTVKINAYIKNLRAQLDKDITKLGTTPGLRIYEQTKLGGR